MPRLRTVSPSDPGWSRRRCGKGFTYLDEHGNRLADDEVILPSLVPAIAAGAALSFARAISEYGSLVLLSGNRPFQTEVASVRIIGYIEGDNLASASVIAAVLLVVALVVIVTLDVIQRRVTRRD
jgi:ABC-type sulfate transport system permease component